VILLRAHSRAVLALAVGCIAHGLEIFADGKRLLGGRLLARALTASLGEPGVERMARNAEISRELGLPAAFLVTPGARLGQQSLHSFRHAVGC